MNNKFKIVIVIALIIMSFSINIYARLDDDYFGTGSSETSSSSSGTSLLNDIFTQGNKLNGTDTDGFGSKIANYITGDIVGVISAVGNLIFAGVTVILGARYIWAGASEKTTVKETLPTFVAAVIFFYLATNLVNFFNPKTTGSIGAVFNGSATYSSVSGKIIGTINTIVQYASFGGILFVGVKYMFESSDGKAKIKERLVPLVLGIVLVFCASTFVNYIISIGQTTLG